MNVLSAGVYELTAIKDIVDCTDHMAVGKVKDTRYLARQLMPTMTELDPEKDVIDMLAFYGASNVQNVADIINKH